MRYGHRRQAIGPVMTSTEFDFVNLQPGFPLMRKPASVILQQSEFGIRVQVQAKTDIARIVTRNLVIKIADTQAGIIINTQLGLDILGVTGVTVEMVFTEIE